MIRTLIIEDSELARIELKNLISGEKDLELLDEATNGQEAIEQINRLTPDLVFLDIHLPDMDGFEVLNRSNLIPRIIFTTAYDEYALRSFDFNTADYLLKPIKREHLVRALDKVRNGLTESRKLSSDDRIFVKDGESCFIVSLGDVTHFHTEGSYTKVFFDGKSPMLHKSLNQIEEGLDNRIFFRVNRQQIVNITHVQNVETWFKGKLKLILSDKSEIEVSERQSVKLKQMLSL